MQQPADKAVIRRRVFYIPGFDPFPPRRYRELYRREGAKQAEVSGYALEIEGRTGAGAYGWAVRGVDGGQRSEADVTVLVWADLVQDSMRSGVLAAYWLMLRTIWIFWSTGAMGAMMRVRRAPMLSGAWPVAVLVAQAAVALGAGWALWRLGAALAPGWGGWAGGIAGIIAAWALLRAFQRLDRKLYAYYLLYDFAHTAQHHGAYGPALEARLAEFAATIRAALAEDCDEVLVVGHSSGAALAVSVVADVLRPGLPDGAPPLALLTLGQAIPLQSFLPRATRLRADLHLLGAHPGLFWLDVSAPGDGCCFGLADPVAVTGVAPRGHRWPLVISAAFSQTLRPETWARMKRRFFRLHFQYLAAFDAPGDYDYFRITAGPMTLAERFHGRKPSPQRITTARAPHRSLE